MFAITGLGNPGSQYSNTRHNVGFCVIDSLYQKLAIISPSTSLSWREKFNCIFCKTVFDDKELILIKPQGFMNNSGSTLRPLLDFFKIELCHTVTVFDDVDLKLGQIKLRLGGSSGGHNGVEDLIHYLGGDKFIRLKVGIGHPRDFNMNIAVKDWVLSRPSLEENIMLEKIKILATEVILTIITKGLEKAQQKYNKPIEI